jgi:hypothetical protein
MSRDDAGVIAIVVALFAVVLFGFAALVVDVGSAADVKAQAAAAADAGALAGSRDLAAWVNTSGPTPDPNLEDAVTMAVALNLQYQGQAWASCRDTTQPGFTPLDSTECIQYRIVTGADGTTVTSTTVRVRIPTRKVQATFGGIFGVGSISVSPIAEAQSGATPSPPCGPCAPALDQDGDPIPPAAELSDDVRRWPLPNPDTTPAGSFDATTDCPTGPGTFVKDLTIVTPCTQLAPGAYIFDSHDVRIEPGGSLNASNVTLVFYGDGKLEVDAGLKALDLTATAVGKPSLGGELPGVALVLAQYPDNPPAGRPPTRTFELGKGFHIGGSVFALGGTLWHTDSGDCPPDLPLACYVDPGDLAVTATEFLGGIPNVAPQKVLPPQPPHLVK